MKRFGLIVLFPLLTALSGQTFPRKVTLLPIAAGSGRGILSKLPLAFDDPVTLLQFSADGRDLLSSTDSIDRTPWPGGSPQTIWAPSGDDTFTGAIFSPDGKQFARADQGRHIHIHETSSGKILQTFEGRTSGPEVAWSPDGKKIAMGSGSDVLLHDLGQGRAMRRIAPGGHDVDSLDWSPDGNWLAVFTRNYKNNKGPAFLIHLSNEATKPILLPGDHDIIFSFSPDSARLAVNGRENNMGFLCLWDIVNQKEIVRIQSWDYNKMKHSPDGRLLVAGGLNELRVLDARNLTDVTRRKADSINHHIYGLAFSPDGSLLAYGVENRIRVRDTRTWDEINPDDTLRSSVNALAFSADGKHLVSGGWNGDIVMWDWQKKAPVWKQLVSSDQWPIDALSIDPTSRWIGVVQSSRARLIQYSTGELHRTLDTGDIGVGGKAAPLFTRDGESAYVATVAQEIIELECANGSVRRRRAYSGKFAVVDSLDFNSRKPELIYWSTATEAAFRFGLMIPEVLDAFETRYNKQGIDIIPTRTHEFLAYGDNIRNLPSLRLMMFPQNNDILPSVRHPSELLYFFARGRTVSVCDLMSQSVITQIDAGPGVVLEDAGRWNGGFEGAELAVVIDGDAEQRVPPAHRRLQLLSHACGLALRVGRRHDERRGS